MRMCPLFSDTGQLLGHVDLDLCVTARDHIIVDNAPRLGTAGLIDEKSTIELVYLPMRNILFRNEHTESVVTHVTTDAEPPAWFWKAPGVVKFSPAQWNR